MNTFSNSHQLIYLVYGPDAAYHAEARFSILSAIYQAKMAPDFEISVYTDAPLYYEGLPVQVNALSSGTLEQWYGPLRYHHRAKLCLLQHAVPLADKTVFIDTDTFFLRDPALLFAAINAETCVADELYHGKLPALTAGNTAVAALLVQYAINPQNIPVINSGLFGIARSNSEVLSMALALNDAVYPASSRSVTTEQLVLGMAAATQTALVADEKVIKHYWSRKQIFRAKAFAFLERHAGDWDSESARADFLRVSPVLPKPPAGVRILAKMLAMLVVKCERQLLLELFYGRYPYRNPFDRACHTVWQQKAVDNYLEKTKYLGKIKSSAADKCHLADNVVAKTILGAARLEKALSQINAARE
jgi:hypothetical protein